MRIPSHASFFFSFSSPLEKEESRCMNAWLQPWKGMHQIFLLFREVCALIFRPHDAKKNVWRPQNTSEIRFFPLFSLTKRRCLRGFELIFLEWCLIWKKCCCCDRQRYRHNKLYEVATIAECHGLFCILLCYVNTVRTGKLKNKYSHFIHQKKILTKFNLGKYI